MSEVHQYKRQISRIVAKMAVRNAEAIGAAALQKQNRWPAGAPGGHGGEFAPQGNGGGSGRAGRSHPAPRDTSRFSQSHPSVARINRRMQQMDDMAAAGDMDFIRNMRTSRGNSYERTVDDYRQDLLTHFEPSARLAAMRGTRPAAPTLTGSNMQNSALVSAQRHVNRMEQIAQEHENPLEAIRALSIGSGSARTNTYLRQAQAHQAALIAHFSSGETAAAAPRAPARSRTVQEGQDASRPQAATPQAAPVARATAPQAARAASISDADVIHEGSENVRYFRGSGGSTMAGSPFPDRSINYAFMDNGRSMTIDDAAVSSVAANPSRIRVRDLGFIPRPNVPLAGVRVDRNGSINERTGTITPWPSPAAKRLAEAYLSQSTSLQSRARDYQAGNWQPETAETRAARTLARAQEEQALAERQRQFAVNEENRRASVPEAFRSRSSVGQNVGSVTARVMSNSFASAALSTKEGLENTAKRLISDYGQGVTFSVTANVSGDRSEISWIGSDGTAMRRNFTANSDGSVSVYHAYFAAGQRGGGAGKRFFRVAMGEYMAMGVKEVTVTANIDVGGYAWARFGYLPKDRATWNTLRGHLMPKLERMKASLQDSTYNAMKQLLENPDRRTLWQVSDFTAADGRKLGKDLLLNSYWSGKIDLNDREQMARFSSYVTQE